MSTQPDPWQTQAADPIRLFGLKWKMGPVVDLASVNLGLAFLVTLNSPRSEATRMDTGFPPSLAPPSSLLLPAFLPYSLPTQPQLG